MWSFHPQENLFIDSGKRDGVVCRIYEKAKVPATKLRDLRQEENTFPVRYVETIVLMSGHQYRLLRPVTERFAFLEQNWLRSIVQQNVDLCRSHLVADDEAFSHTNRPWQVATKDVSKNCLTVFSYGQPMPDEMLESILLRIEFLG